MLVAVPSRYRQQLAESQALGSVTSKLVYYDFERQPPSLVEKAMSLVARRVSSTSTLKFSPLAQAKAANLVEGAVLDWGIHPREMDTLLDRMHSIRWLHAMSAGVDHLAVDRIIQNRISLTSGKGMRSKAVSEFGMGLIYLAAKRFLAHHRTNRSSVAQTQLIADSTVCVLGTGSIGQAVARLAGLNGMNVIGVNTTGSPSPGIQKVVSVRELEKVLTQTNFLVVCLPLTPKTRGILDSKHLGSLKDGACLICLGRLELINGKCLADLIRSRKLAGAFLDVDPLERHHPCFGVENILVTNHSAFLTEDDNRLMVEGMVANVLRFFKGEPMLGLVDAEKGY